MRIKGRAGKPLYTPDGFKAITVKSPWKLRYFVLAAIFCLFMIPLLVMLDVRTDTEIAEWWTVTVQAGWERVVGTLVSILPFSVLELFVCLGIVLGLYLLVRFYINLLKGRFKKILLGVLSIAVGGVYILNMYVMSMGFGYYRAPMPLPQAGREYKAEQAKAAVEYFLEDFNALAESVERDGNGCAVCPYTFSELAELIKEEYRRLPDVYFNRYTPTAKKIVNSWLLSDMLITGVTFLPFGEAGINTDAPPTSVTITVAHELAHAKGIQREGDANLLARYILLSSDNDYLRYCGYYHSFYNLLEALLLAGDNDGYSSCGNRVSRKVYPERVYTREYWNSQPDIIGKIAEFFNDL